ncbi:laccase [Pyrrhoderma noxium]|uniref:Laccase n=1 Tax=Pyrrhoderma noxium TaxID=2282107 RepID=A0A286UVV4_9AGAM|nr:laccase [Pyrrhoderma noxium]
MLKPATLLSLFAFALHHTALADVVSMDLTVSNVDVSPDGVTRSATVVNGQLPGPLVSGNLGDNFQLNVIDELTDTTMYRSTTIHWHGMFQNGTTDMDGVAMVSQCPIVPGNSFLYNFSVPNQYGTFWYHSHLATQYCDGLRGPLIIYNPDDPLADLYDVDDDTTIITLSDWYQDVSTSLFPNTGFADPSPDSTLINGLGRYSGDPTSSLAVVNVTEGQRYRFRIINMGCYPSYTFQIDGHNMTVIEADGVETESVTVNSLVIYAGQRYSVVVTANQTVGNYWIRANPSAGTTGFTDGINSAILRYSGADDEEPTTIQNTEGTTLDEADLHPLENPGAPGEAVSGGVDYALNFDIGINLTSGLHMVNDVVYQSPSVPVLLQILNGASASDLLPSGSVYTLPGNSSIEISFSSGFAHPMHLHGHTFDVVRVAGSDTYNYDNPVRRDVVNIGTTSDNVTIRFTTDNAGPWHLEAGLAIVFDEAHDEIEAATKVTDAWSELCPSYAASNPDTALEASVSAAING